MRNETRQYPDITNFDYEQPIDENVYELIREILIEKAIHVITNTILQNYIKPESVKANIQTYASKIILNPSKITSISDITLGVNEVFLTPHFFTNTIKTIKSHNNDLTLYPRFIKILEIYGLTIAFANTKDKVPYLGTSPYRKDVFIKKLIANHFSSQLPTPQKKSFTFKDYTFQTYATTNEIATNMIAVIAKLLGEEALVEVLINEEPEKILSKKIDELTNKSRLGIDFIQKLRILNNYFDNILRINENQEFYKKIFSLKIEEDYNIFIENIINDLTFHINCVTNIICSEIIPKALKNKKTAISSEEFEETLSLMTYQNSSIINNKKTEKKIQKTKKQLLKQKIIH